MFFYVSPYKFKPILILLFIKSDPNNINPLFLYLYSCLNLEKILKLIVNFIVIVLCVYAT